MLAGVIDHQVELVGEGAVAELVAVGEVDDFGAGIEGPEEAIAGHGVVGEIFAGDDAGVDDAGFGDQAGVVGAVADIEAGDAGGVSCAGGVVIGRAGAGEVF